MAKAGQNAKYKTKCKMQNAKYPWNMVKKSVFGISCKKGQKCPISMIYFPSKLQRFPSKSTISQE